MIGKVVTGCVAILPYHTATQDRGSECRDFGFISRIVTALIITLNITDANWTLHEYYNKCIQGATGWMPIFHELI